MEVKETIRLEGLSREMIALRASKEIADGDYVNLGIGIPTLISNWIEGRDIMLQSEIGMIKTGPLAFGDDVDQDLINASCQAVTQLPGTAYFDIAESFAMIRGGYMDVIVVGALQVSENGDLAGWANPATMFSMPPTTIRNESSAVILGRSLHVIIFPGFVSHSTPGPMADSPEDG